jgi:hypothetical protein
MRFVYKQSTCRILSRMGVIVPAMFVMSSIWETVVVRAVYVGYGG